MHDKYYYNRFVFCSLRTVVPDVRAETLSFSHYFDYYTPPTVTRPRNSRRFPRYRQDSATSLSLSRSLSLDLYVFRPRALCVRPFLPFFPSPSASFPSSIPLSESRADKSAHRVRYRHQIRLAHKYEHKAGMIL